jgi:hypothetical protein
VRCHIQPDERREIAAGLLSSPLGGHAALAVAGGGEQVLRVGAGDSAADQTNGAAG